jgi:hypothetical protein
MIPFRIKTPQRRATPTKNPTGENWGEHKPDLKEDFSSCCGYCDSFDGFRHTYFEVDHFVPKSLLKVHGTMSLTEYKNLVYSCKFCNNIKRAKWPSKKVNVPNVNNEGFVDPCLDEYADHLCRLVDGGVMWQTDLGKWMFTEGFKFDERQEANKVLWLLNKLRITIKELIQIQKKFSINSEEYNSIDLNLNKYTREYFVYHQELIEYYG